MEVLGAKDVERVLNKVFEKGAEVKVVEPKEEYTTDIAIAKKLCQLKQSADSRGIVFDLSFNVLKRLLRAKNCFYTGKLFTHEGKYARSIDRVDSDLGYIDDNVVACTIDINQKKTNLSWTEIFQMNSGVIKHKNSLEKRSSVKKKRK